MKKNVILMIAGFIAGVVVTFASLTWYYSPEQYVSEDIRLAIQGYDYPKQISWMGDALDQNNMLVWKYATYEECVNHFLGELDSIYNIQDMYPGYLQDAEDEVAKQWEEEIFID